MIKGSWKALRKPYRTVQIQLTVQIVISLQEAEDHIFQCVKFLFFFSHYTNEQVKMNQKITMGKKKRLFCHRLKSNPFFSGLSVLAMFLSFSRSRVYLSWKEPWKASNIMPLILASPFYHNVKFNVNIK